MAFIAENVIHETHTFFSARIVCLVADGCAIFQKTIVRIFDSLIKSLLRLTNEKKESKTLTDH